MEDFELDPEEYPKTAKYFEKHDNDIMIITFVIILTGIVLIIFKGGL